MLEVEQRSRRRMRRRRARKTILHFLSVFVCSLDQRALPVLVPGVSKRPWILIPLYYMTSAKRVQVWWLVKKR